MWALIVPSIFTILPLQDCFVFRSVSLPTHAQHIRKTQTQEVLSEVHDFVSQEEDCKSKKRSGHPQYGICQSMSVTSALAPKRQPSTVAKKSVVSVVAK